ncbi:MAG: glycosyltransferase family 2 protein [Sphingobacteriaceae bacterium]|nr:MAG: glycosyltransferase family 2 protein [Sphingobacteriaceae bacterium]
MKTPNKSISIIIPNYNGIKLLQQYMPCTIDAIVNAGVDFEIIIVDDCSTDDSVNFIKTNYPEIKLIESPQNKGFSHSCNLGIQASRCQLILLLNSDVKLTPGYFLHQWRYFDKDDTFGVMGRIIDMDGDHIQDAARMPKFNGLKLKTGYFYYTQNGTDDIQTLYLSGANALVDAAKLKAIGGFYELFSPFYCEDMELSVRAQRLGWKCYYEHQAICRHEMSTTTKKIKRTWVKTIYHRNRYYFHALHLNGGARALWYMQITLELIFKLLAGQFWLLKSYKELLRTQKNISLYRDKTAALFAAHHINLSLFDVIDALKASVKGKSITRFKP